MGSVHSRGHREMLAYTGVVPGLKRIVREEGFIGLWRYARKGGKGMNAEIQP